MGGRVDRSTPGDASEAILGRSEADGEHRDRRGTRGESGGRDHESLMRSAMPARSPRARNSSNGSAARQTGSLYFQHSPRFYFEFEPYRP
jgi:hypothetical protein